MSRTIPKPSAGDAFVLEDFVPFKLAVLSERVSRLIATDYSEQFGVTIAEWRVMALVSQYSEVRAQTVVEKTPMDKVAVSRAVASLVQKGLLEKRASPADRRSALLHLSEQGLRVAHQIQAVALSHDDAIMSALSADEKEAFGILLDKLLQKSGTLAED